MNPNCASETNVFHLPFIVQVAIAGDSAAADVYHRTFTHCVLCIVMCAAVFFGAKDYVEMKVKTTPYLSFVKSMFRRTLW